MCEPAVEKSFAVVLQVARVEEAVARRVARAEPERPRGQAERQRGGEADHPGPQRVERGDHRAHHDHRARGEQHDRRRVAHAAEHEQDRARERLPHLAAGPAEVEDAREEGREGHEAEADQVPVALLQHRHLDLGQPGPARRAALAPASVGHNACIRRQYRSPSLPWGDMSGRPRVLVVEDDADIAGVLRRSLDKEGYEVRVAGDGEAALAESGVFEPDAVVLDLGLPKLDGMEVARRMREDGDVPILMLTARDALDARVEGLDSGADDYLVKPFEREELLARIRALLRRRPPRGSAFLVVGDLRLNPDSREVYRGSRALELTAREFELLEHLMRNERIVVSRQALLDEVWGYHPFAETNTVDVFISNLRRKLEAGGEPRLLHTMRGAGYVLRES
jgi:two-component system, OmpR family, response regulator MprA